jgi:hypothetical protein
MRTILAVGVVIWMAAVSLLAPRAPGGLRAVRTGSGGEQF